LNAQRRQRPALTEGLPFLLQRYWIPACAGMTRYGCNLRENTYPQFTIIFTRLPPFHK
jgi:hypothetical protein